MIRYKHDQCLTISTAHAFSHGLLRGFEMLSLSADIPLMQYEEDTTLFMKGCVKEAGNLSLLLDIFGLFGPSYQLCQITFSQVQPIARGGSMHS